MQFFIDTANLDEIRAARDMGVLDGVTTNPSLVAKEGVPMRKRLEEICALVDGPISAEVDSGSADQMVAEGREHATIHQNIVVKLPLNLEGLRACKTLKGLGIKTNVTLCFSANQALLAAKAGATYISPFVGRLDDISQDGMELIQQIVTIYRNYDFDTKVLVASVRHPVHVLQAALIGAHVATIPFKVIDQLVKHPLTNAGLAQFEADYKKIPGKA